MDGVVEVCTGLSWKVAVLARSAPIGCRVGSTLLDTMFFGNWHECIVIRGVRMRVSEGLHVCICTVVLLRASGWGCYLVVANSSDIVCGSRLNTDSLLVSIHYGASYAITRLHVEQAH